MPRYLFKVSYTAEGLKGLLKEGGFGRRDLAKKVIEDLGGKLEAFYFAFGDTDAYTIVELPDHASAAAASLVASASGAVQFSTVVLMTPEEIDEATKKSVAYRPPGA